MITHVGFKIIHWEFNSPVDNTLKPIVDSYMLPFNLRYPIDDKIKGIRFRWTLRIKSEIEQLLSYIAEDEFGFDDLKEITIEILDDLIKSSHNNYSKEFDEKKGDSKVLTFPKIYRPLYKS